MRHRDYQYNPTTGQAELVADWDDGEPEPEQVNLMAVSRDAEVAGLEAFEESLTAAGLPLTMAKLKAAQIAGVNEKIDYMTANGGLG